MYAHQRLITFLVVILVLYLINMLPLDGRAKQIARVVVIIIGVISLLKSRGVLGRPRERTKKAPAMPGLFIYRCGTYFSVLNQSSTSLWIWSLAKP